MAGASGGAGGMSNSSSAAARSGNISNGGQHFGGINVAPNGFKFEAKHAYIAAGAFVGFIVLKKMKII